MVRCTCQCHTHFGSEHFCPNLECWVGSAHENRHPMPCRHTALCTWLQHNPHPSCQRAMIISTLNTPGAPLASQSFGREEVSFTQVHPLSMGLKLQLCAAESSPHGQSGSKGDPPCSAKNSSALSESTLPTFWVFKALSFIPPINELYYLIHLKTAFERLKHWLNTKGWLYQHWHSKILMYFHNCMQQFTASTELWLWIRIKQRKTSGSFILKARPEQS